MAEASTSRISVHRAAAELLESGLVPPLHCGALRIRGATGLWWWSSSVRALVASTGL